MGSRLHRRRVLQLASSGVLAWSLGPLVAGCTRISRAGAGELADAWERARMHGRPLLVLLADIRCPADRGMEWSAYFDLASDGAMAELSSCELAFAAMEQVRAVLPFVPIDGPELPQALLVEPDDGVIAEIPVG